MNQADWTLRSAYSEVRSACVTPSTASTIGHAKSYVGYTLSKFEHKNSIEIQLERETADSLVLVSRAWMRFRFASVDGRIAHATVVGLHVDLSANDCLEASYTSFLHLIPHRQVLFNSCKNILIITVS